MVDVLVLYMVKRCVGWVGFVSVLVGSWLVLVDWVGECVKGDDVKEAEVVCGESGMLLVPALSIATFFFSFLSLQSWFVVLWGRENTKWNQVKRCKVSRGEGRAHVMFSFSFLLFQLLVCNFAVRWDQARRGRDEGRKDRCDASFISLRRRFVLR